jgi:ADP-dependent phosphofructokinase/glucokinase
MFKLRVKFLESFKDGMILEGRNFNVNEVAVLEEMDVEKIINSGGEVEVLETLIPNPLKQTETQPAEKEDAKKVEQSVKKVRGKRVQ